MAAYKGTEMHVVRVLIIKSCVMVWTQGRLPDDMIVSCYVKSE